MVFLEPMRYTRVSEHFFWNEMLTSATADKYGVINVPVTETHTNNIIATANKMETVRSLLGNKVIVVLSCYRTAKVNKLVGGSTTSAHLEGMAVDFICNGAGDPTTIVSILRKNQKVLKFDQIINEFDRWVHIGWSDKERGEILKATKSHNKAKTIYTRI